MTDTLEPKPAEPVAHKVCPQCFVLAAVGSNPHCHNKSCTWFDCRCNHTWDKFTLNFFKTPPKTTKKAA